MRKTLIGVILLLAVAACGDDDTVANPSLAPDVATTSTVDVAANSDGSVVTTSVPQPRTTSSSATATTNPPRSLDDLEIEPFEVASGFSQPVLMVAAPDDEQWFVVDQPGTVWAIVDGEPSVFLDITDLVRFQGEQGLLGMAFHPEFESNGLFYVNYTDDAGDSIVASVETNGGSARTESLTEILRVDQPAANHNGGMIAFGPDGNLWVGFGDGGGADDQFGQGQRADTLLGAMVRITVGPEIDGYSVPSGNLDGEVWAQGLRNPWRFDFDGDYLWIADVGQNRIEEVDVVDWTDGNPNFGWSVMEGTECFRNDGCDPGAFAAPAYEYSHSEGCSVTGGFAYRGSAMPELAGQYLFADYCSGWVRSVDRAGNVREWLAAGSFSNVTGFGVDAAGEVYVLTAGGSIFALRPVS